MNNLRCLVFLFLIVTYFSEAGYSQYFAGPVSSALGGAGLAANDEAEQLLFNPSVLTHAKDLAVGYYFADGYRDKNEHDNFYGLTVTDNASETGIAGGAALFKRRRTFDRQNSRDEIVGQFSVAKNIIKHISAGLTLEHYRTDIEGADKHKQTDLTLGFLANPNPELGLGLVLRNLLKQKKSVPESIRLNDEIGIGVNYIFMPQFRGRFDVVQQAQNNPDHERTYKLGFESFIDAFFVLRFGYQINDLDDRNNYSVGFGFTGPRLKIDYSFVQNEDYSKGAMHSVDFRLPF